VRTSDREASLYLIVLGSNQPHHRHGSPHRVIGAAVAAMEQADLSVERASRIVTSRPIGPSRRTYANAAAIARTDLEPSDLLAELQGIEARFGRRRRGQRWGARVLDLDIVLWSGGAWVSPGLLLPHVSFRERHFVLGPAAEIAGDWRDPLTGFSVRQLRARLKRS